MSDVYRYTLWNRHQRHVSIYQLRGGIRWAYTGYTQIPEIFTLLKVKQRLSDTHTVHVFMQDERVIDEPA